ncbi:MAG: hypothetical protein WCJ09_08045 [Planctomycetota bacterium]
MNKTLLVLCILVIVVAGCAEQPITAEPPSIDFTIAAESRANLTDGVRTILEAMENGTLPGTDAATIQPVLDGATEIKRSKQQRILFFRSTATKATSNTILSFTWSFKTGLITA